MKRTFKFSNLVFVTGTGICILSVWLMFLQNRGARKDCQVRIYQKINPNKASALSLSRLPGIGITKATTMVKYRTENSKNDERAFGCISDLRMVKGIGAKTGKANEKWLVFE